MNVSVMMARKDAEELRRDINEASDEEPDV